MGSFMSTGQAQVAADSLNGQFGPQNIASTFATIEELRKAFPNFLNPMQNPGPRDKRKQTLRFAAFQINDQINFSANYPAPKFTHWLRWLTWLNLQQNGLFTIDGAAFGGTAGQLVVKVLAQALPPGGNPSPINFAYIHDSDISNLAVEATTNPDFKIIVTAPKHSEVTGNDEDNV
jgi:hypothetical protein